MKRCFIIGPQKGAKGEKRAVSEKAKTRAEWVYKVVEAALGEDYEIEHVRKSTGVGMAMADITKHLVEDDLVVADVMVGDPSVYYEIAIRHAVGKPIVHLGTIGQVLPSAVTGLNFIKGKVDDQLYTIEKIRLSVRLTEEPGYESDTPLVQARIRQVFYDRATEEEKVVAKFFDSVSGKIDLQFAQLQSLTRQLEDSMRKPLHGIDEVFLQLDSMLQNVKKGGRLWFVGMTLGLGPPHKYRMSRWPANNRRVQTSNGGSADDANQPTCTIDELFKLKWKGKEPAPSIDKMITDLHQALGLAVEKAHEPVVVCLTNDREALEKKFLGKLAKRRSYSTLKSEMDNVIGEIIKLHRALAEKVPANKPIKYIDSIPLQILIVERGDALPMSVNRKACVVFHVGTGNIETGVLEDGETGFYTEVDSVVEMFETMAESLWEAGQFSP